MYFRVVWIDVLTVCLRCAKALSVRVETAHYAGVDPPNVRRTADYLAQKLSEKLRLQLDQAVDFSGVTFVAGPDLMWDWVKLDLDDQAFTPGNYRERQASRQAAVQSVYILDKSQGTIIS